MIDGVQSKARLHVQPDAKILETMYLIWTFSREPKSVTAFNLFTFFRADLTQSEASWQLSLSSDWLIPYLN